MDRQHLPNTVVGHSGLDPPGFVGPHGNLNPIPGRQLGHEMGQVGLDRAEADVQLTSNLGIGKALGHCEEDLLFSLSQCFDWLNWFP